MARSVQMPPLGESVTEGTVSRWLKQVGDTVEVDEILVEITTDKVDTEIPSPFAGVLERIVVAEDETAEVGAELAVIGEPGEASPDGAGSPAAQEPEGSARETPQETAQDAGQDTAQDTMEEPAREAAPERPAPQAGSVPAAAPAGGTAAATPAAAEAAATPPAGQGGAAAGGSVDLVMPPLGESVTEGTITRWLVGVGDTVEVDQPVVEVSTDKVDTEVPSSVAGTVLEVVVAEDGTAAVGDVLARLGSPASHGHAPAEAVPAAEAAPAEEPEPEPGAAAPAGMQAEAAAPAAVATEELAPASGADSDGHMTAPLVGGEAPPSAAVTAPAPATDAPSAPTPAPTTATTATAVAGNGAGPATPYVTPIVRKLASDLGVDLAAVTGSGVGGRIRRQDVTDAADAARAAAEAEAAARAEAEVARPAPQAPAATGTATARPGPDPRRGTTEPMSRTRRLIATRMVESLQTSAQLTTVVEVDVTRVARLRARAKAAFEQREGVKLSFLPFFALAAVEALKVHPVVNASTDGTSVTYHASENLGIAVDTERGLIVPVIKDAGDLNLAGLARRIADLAVRTRSKKVGPDDLSGSTFTLTNTGSRGALFDTPIINQPEVAILGTGAVVKRPAVVPDPDGGDTIAVRSMVYLALSYDHRIVDGADAARFLATVRGRLEEGAFEAELGL